MTTRAATHESPLPEEFAAQVLDAFHGRIPPVSVSLVYRLGLVVVALAMVLLPLLYVGLIVLTAYGVYWHVVHNVVFFQQMSGRVALFAYATPPIVGCILLLFLIKPLFARQAKVQQPRRLKPELEPLLFAFVERICNAVQAPVPREIRVDCQVNAAASFRRGSGSLFGNDLTLTIGLPLTAGMDLRQFAGVLAHEFGHFAQGAGMRLTYIIRTVNVWFMRVVYERDVWDERLKNWSGELDVRLGIVFYLARIFVWTTRKVLWVLMWIGHVLSCFMLRQMEYDADRYEAQLAGSKTFASTARRLAVLSLAHQMANADLEQFWDEGRLADDLPALILANVEQIPPNVLKDVRQRERETTTGLFDTHPATRDRVASAHQENAAGIFNLEEDDAPQIPPASVLFSAFEKLSQAVSLEFYREALGREVKPEMLFPVSELLSKQGEEIAAGKALGRYFQGKLSPLRPAPMPAEPFAAPENPQQLAETVKSARQSMLQALDRYADDFKRFDQADTDIIESLQAAALLEAKFKFAPAEFNLTRATLAETSSKRKKALAEQEALHPGMQAFETSASQRLFAALRLLHVPQLVQRVEGGAELKLEVASLFPAARLTSKLMPDLVELRNAYQALAILCAKLEGNKENQTLIGAVRNKMSKVRKGLKSLQPALGDTPYPFEHAREDVTIREYALSEIPGRDDLGEILSAGGEVLDKLFALHMRLFARLALAAEKLESAIGLPPLSEPDDAEEKA